MPGICNEQPFQPLQEQAKQAPPQLGVESLWKEAAESLDPGDRKKLDNLIQSKREGQAAGLSPNGHREVPSADDVSLIISRAKRLKDKDQKATWRPVSSTPSQDLGKLHVQFLF
jgi:hypothetical protein